MKLLKKQWKTCLYGHLQETSAHYCKFIRDGCPCEQPLHRIEEKTMGEEFRI